MPKYPQEITPTMLAGLANISDDTVARDIRDTEQEIVTLEKEIEGYRLIAEANPSTPRGKMADFHATSATLRAEERTEFVGFLKRLQEARAKVKQEIP